MIKVWNKIWHEAWKIAGLMMLVFIAGWCFVTAPQTVRAAADSPFPGMVLIPGGPFIMGRDQGPVDEQPGHELSLPTFYIDRHLVTVAEFVLFVQAKGTHSPQGEMYLDVYDSDNRIHQHNGVWLADHGFERHPAGEVSWHGALAYCQWREKRLPSEAEWEKAARGTDGRLYPWGNNPPQPDLAFFGALRGQTVPIGQYPKGISPYGVHDMAGQVWEWTISIYQSYPYNPDDGRETLSTVAPRVARGGSSSSSAEGLTATSREIISPSRQATGHAYLGFRCAKSLEMVSYAR